jgi:hypothetical protein
MKFYPVRVPRDAYGGRKPRLLRKRSEFNRVAQRVEEYLNTDPERQPDDTVISFLSYAIADVLQEDVELVRDVVYGIDAGAGGVTICKGNLDKALRRQSQDPEN